MIGIPQTVCLTPKTMANYGAWMTGVFDRCHPLYTHTYGLSLVVKSGDAARPLAVVLQGEKNLVATFTEFEHLIILTLFAP